MSKDPHSFLPLGSQVVRLNPFEGKPVRLSPLEGLTPDQVVETLTVMAGVEVPPAPRAILHVTVSQMQQSATPSLLALLDRAVQAEERVAALVQEHRILYDPLREGSLLLGILKLIRQDVQPADLQVVSVQSSGPYDLPPNPWAVLAEGDEVGANALLRAALGWEEVYAPQAATVLREHK
ncbi:hypothetical protein [Deinococcus aluminii]|uniref:hypothetical protein n=1 Tax=Deinococcus aluminii TaxID=1656885 RepID=UPI0031E67513